MMKSIYLIFLLLAALHNLASCRQRKHPLILISLDGFRADKFEKFMDENPQSNFNYLRQNGVKADYMKPVFPSFTFVNHWALATGLYPESNGIVANTFFSEKYNQTVPLQTPEGANIQWWNASKPIWLTAREQGLKTATNFWPGSETYPYTADIYLPFIKYADKTLRALQTAEWIKKMDVDFATLYLDQPDGEGHAHGPDSPEYYDMIRNMDGVIGTLIQRLKDYNLFDSTNIIIISDHGMAHIKSPSDYILLSEHFDTSIIDSRKTIYSKISQVYPVSEDLTTELVDKINQIPHLKAYRREDVPARFHYNKNQRIGRVVVLADEGYTLAANRDEYRPGHHGYDNDLPNMRAIFMASGPDFAKNRQIGGFDNVNIYPLMCNLLKIKCQNSNSTINLADYVLVKHNTVDNTIINNIFSIINSIFGKF